MCVSANMNILSLYDGSYSTCTNLEWYVTSPIPIPIPTGPSWADAAARSPGGQRLGAHDVTSPTRPPCASHAIVVTPSDLPCIGDASRQVCAARGLLPGQGRASGMAFAWPPNQLEPASGWRPIGSCTGYHPKGCGAAGYASSDIYYLETCIFSSICHNRESLFRLAAGQTWQCELDERGFERLRDRVLGGLV